ncbi:drug/metabolite transporter (DMT)-like permease [Motilibacter peucedani]|uniref:Drug/metabolite transporter (DMT)-like permease n=2 Tax=Motilibacter peucedani TaxID=598650 RepID=A0A420XRJ7_9ACTN|nr:drug/metabolite transporter (DMT)-like permease [Motilibacter peucedani]
MGGGRVRFASGMSSSSGGTRRDGTGWVALAAALWGSDALLRAHLVKAVPSATIVLAEHAIAVVLLLPVLVRTFPAVRRLDLRGKLALIGIGGGASALATVLFTEAFTYGDYIAPALLQQAQPLIAIAGARLLLGERPRLRFAPFVAVALVGGFLVAFPHPGDVAVSSVRGALLALAAATLWGSGTVLGRLLSVSLSFEATTAWRFAVGLPTALVLALLLDAPVVPPAADLPALAGLALGPGLLSLLLYYWGLQRTPAARATLAELAYPVTAAVVGVLFLSGSLTATQVLGGVLVAGTVTLLALASQRRGAATVEAPPPPVLVEAG